MTLAAHCKDLSVGWPGRPLIEGMSAEIQFAPLNNTLPIIGRTGRGKSTLLYALSGMSQPMSGAIRWVLPADGDEVSWDADSGSFSGINEIRRRKFGFLLQDAMMIPCFTVLENLEHILRLRHIKDGTRERAEASIEKMLIEGETVGHFRDQYPMRLSGGMRQRMALAAAIAHDPQVLFADEPTASLDDTSGMEVLRVVRRWLDDKPGERAFVFVTHRLETLEKGAGATQVMRLSTETIDGVPRVVTRMEPLH